MLKSPLLSIVLAVLFCGAIEAQQAPSGFSAPVQASATQTQQQTPSLQQIIAQNRQKTAFRIKDLTSIGGHRPHRLMGTGLVTGLAGSGSDDPQTKQFARNFFQSFNIRLDNNIATKNMAVVGVTAEVPPFTNPGEKLVVDVTLMSDAISLFNGHLQATEMLGDDGQAYAVALGPITMGGFSAGGAGASVTKNHIASGKATAILEVPMDDEPAFPGRSFVLQLINKDNTTAARIESEINRLGQGIARAINAGSVEVFFPTNFHGSKLEFVASIGSLTIVPDMPARVVVNQKTGVITAGHNVKISTSMFSVRNLVITTTESPIVSQPAPLSNGETVVVPRTQVEANEINSRYNVLNENPTIGDLANALNALGLPPSDLISVLQSLKRQGNLQAELVVE